MKYVRKFILVLIVMLMPVFVNAEENLGKIDLKTQFDNELDGFLLNIVETNDGNYAAVNMQDLGISVPNRIVKFDKEGKFLYKSNKFYSGKSDLIETSNNMIISTSNKDDDLDFEGYVNVYDESAKAPTNQIDR